MVSKASILLIEGKHTDRPSFLNGLIKKGFRVSSVPNGTAAMEHLAEEIPNIVVIDAASMRTSGKRICQSMRENTRKLPILLILPERATPDPNIDVDSTLILPFTPQKLYNRIRPFLPVREADLMKTGPIELDIKQRLVRCHGEQARLTPRLVVLLRFLMEKPGEVIYREDLFKKVWETNYTGDTRTLDVHISWLRQALGDDPREPQMLKTLRGVGYRLDIDE
jgi:DNA-binding response OmpR family regulator